MRGLFALLAAAFLAVLVAACGGNGEGPELGDFPAISKGDQDPPFPLTAPSSRSPAPFTFTSSNDKVATIEGAMVTIRGIGTTEITASQPSVGSYGPTRKSTTLTVTAGKSPPPTTTPTTTTCVTPATLKEKLCLVEGNVATVNTTNPTLTWTRTTRQDTWTNARDYCMGSTINNEPEWRLPSTAELDVLRTSGALSGRGWALGRTWSSALGASTSEHKAVDLANAGASSGQATSEQADTATAYITCVR